MAKLQHNALLLGLAVGAGSLMALRGLWPLLSDIAKPVTKSAIKFSLTAFDSIREGMARLSETLDDISAEAHAEVVFERKSAPKKVRVNDVASAPVPDSAAESVRERVREREAG